MPEGPQLHVASNLQLPLTRVTMLWLVSISYTAAAVMAAAVIWLPQPISCRQLWWVASFVLLKTAAAMYGVTGVGRIYETCIS